MTNHVCHACAASGELRVDMQDTAYGPAMLLTCEGCYSKDVAERQAEGRKFHYRPKIVPWAKLKAV